MKYSLETTDSGKCIETFEVNGHKYECTHVRTEYGSHSSIDTCIENQMEGIEAEELIDRFVDSFDTFQATELLEMAEEFE